MEGMPSLRKQAFALLSTQTLLAATADGIYEVREGEARLVRPGLARGFAKSRSVQRVWVATQKGVLALQKQGQRWSPGPLLALKNAGPDSEPLAEVEATSVGEDSNGRLWISLITGRVISGLPAQRGEVLELTDVRSFGEAEGLSAGFAEVISLGDGVRIGTGTALDNAPSIGDTLGHARDRHDDVCRPRRSAVEAWREDDGLRGPHPTSGR